jgi:hypothetical protein
VRAQPYTCILARLCPIACMGPARNRHGEHTGRMALVPSSQPNPAASPAQARSAPGVAAARLKPFRTGVVWRDEPCEGASRRHWCRCGPSLEALGAPLFLAPRRDLDRSCSVRPPLPVVSKSGGLAAQTLYVMGRHYGTGQRARRYCLCGLAQEVITSGKRVQRVSNGQPRHLAGRCERKERSSRFPHIHTSLTHCLGPCAVALHTM